MQQPSGTALSVPDAIPVLGVASIFHAGYLLRCVRSIDFPVQTLVVIHNGDDAEVGAAVALLQRERPALQVVREPVNTGCAGGWNRVLAANSSAPWWLIVVRT
jgi:GT2 family glycosyltransferase